MVCGSASERKKLAGAIAALGNATSVSSHTFVADATHVLAAELKRTEKLMCACAKGLWVLRPEFVLKSLEGGSWLPEEHFEWTSTGPGMHSPRGVVGEADMWPGAPKRCRLLWQNAQLGVFKGAPLSPYTRACCTHGVHRLEGLR